VADIPYTESATGDLSLPVANSERVAGLCNLGRYFEFGHGIARDAKRSADCYQLSADQDDVGSQTCLWFFRQHGIGFEEDLAGGVEYYQEAANAQKVDAMSHCGLCLHYGLGFDVDLDEASSFYSSFTTQPDLENHAFRCLRCLNKARIGRSSLPRRSPRPHDPPVDDFATIRPLTVSLNMKDYRISLVGMAGNQLIGTGGHTQVSLKRDLIHKRKTAIKQFSITCPRSDFLREVEIMVKLNHPFVLRIMKWALSDGLTEAQIHTEFAANGSLNEVIEKVNCVTKPTFWTSTGIGILICSLVLGMRYIHSRRIIHHDLKPSNILINEMRRSMCGFAILGRVVQKMTLRR
jgi:hypothetical protein